MRAQARADLAGVAKENIAGPAAAADRGRVWTCLWQVAQQKVRHAGKDHDSERLQSIGQRFPQHLRFTVTSGVIFGIGERIHRRHLGRETDRPGRRDFP